MSGQIEFREYLEEDFESFLRLHNDVFPPVTADEMAHWLAGDDVTAGVAVRGGEVVGEIPVHIREFMVRPGVTVRAAFEHSVCVAGDVRGTGIGTHIQNAMKQFLAGRADALTVYRGGERTPAYRFYEKNGLVDLTYHRIYTLADPGSAASQAFELVDMSEMLRHENGMLHVFEDSLGHVGGRQVRGPGFFAETLENLEMCEIKPLLGGLLAEEADGLAGYCILSIGRRTSDPLHIMEVASRGRDPQLTEALVRTACSVAADRGTRVTVSLHEFGEGWDVFRDLGFVGSPRGSMIMGTPLDWEGMADRVWWDQPGLADVQADLFTPEEDATLRRPPGGVARTVTLEMKHRQASRYLFSRLDLAGAVAREMLTVRDATLQDVEALGRAIPFSAWEIRDFEHI